jgi:hypothetical protein
MNKIYLFSFIFVLLILQSCSYEPKGNNFVKIDPKGVIPDVQYNLNFATDTIYIQRTDKITFSYTRNGDKVNWAKFIFNGHETVEQTSSSGTIELTLAINDADFAKGTFPLEMQLFTRSQTGSVADYSGAEGFLLSKTWTIVVRDSYHMGSSIQKIECVDGTLKIDWDIFKGLDFMGYKIYKSMPDVRPTSNSIKLVASISSQAQTSCVDNTYHGEKSNYYVIVNEKFQGNSMQFTGPFPVVTASNTISGDILLKWTKSPFYKNLKGYRITYRDYQGNYQQVTDINSADIEFLVIPNQFFVYNYEFYLTLVPLTDNYLDDLNSLYLLSSKVKAAYGITSPLFTRALAGLAPLSYLLNEPQGVSVFDHQNSTITRQIKYPEAISQFDISANNKYMVSVTASPKRIYLEDLTNSANNKKFDFTSTFPQLGFCASVSDIGTGVFFNGQSIVLYDYIHETKLAETNFTYVGEFPNKISPSGNFIYLEAYSSSEFYQYKNNQLIHLPANIPTGAAWINFVDYLPGTNEKMVRVYNNTIQLIDCNTWTVEKQWTSATGFTEVYNLDLKSGKLFLRETYKLELFDPMTGTKELLATTTMSSDVTKWSLIYNNSQVLWGLGKMLK